jgi:hypothetical protein
LSQNRTDKQTAADYDKRRTDSPSPDSAERADDSNLGFLILILGFHMLGEASAFPARGTKDRISQSVFRVLRAFHFKAGRLGETSGMNCSKVGKGTSARRTLFQVCLHHFPFCLLDFAGCG